ncbi:DNA-binding transcriptional LysR family regulator [Breoghania corrubedonensis]|uniref:DNA-binding transcriptional LysR family regulator n=1 Tax=Breoghania corrubedonensis TaxID=665038 RepID=A0A2T5VG21_9HYPH|nr:LysR family transcriptional regulator [Breoghania corrubedonensis]PTW62678.1 DNA-binding transcriptional LysR family regulator [Breoghania corrubedonensis]
MLTWNDHHLVLTVSRSGTIAGAARRLGINETTVARRLASVEGEAGATLFRRMDGKLVANAAGRAIAIAAEAMENALADASRSTEVLHGIVRVTSVLSVIEHMIAPHLPHFAQRHPNLVLELIGTNETASLARREVDIAIRLERPARGKLVARRLGRIRFLLAGRVGTKPEGYVAYERDLDHAPEIVAVRKYFDGASPRARIATLAGMRVAVEAGMGGAMLPEWMISQSSGIGVIDPSVSIERPLWLVVHEDVKKRPAVRAACDWLAEIVTGARGANGYLTQAS